MMVIAVAASAGGLTFLLAGALRYAYGRLALRRSAPSSDFWRGLIKGVDL